MTEAHKLSDATRKKVEEHADGAIRESGRRLKRNLTGFAASAVAAVAIGVLFPPVSLIPALALTLPLATGMIFGTNAAGHYLNREAMQGVKAEAGEETFVEKMKAKAARFAKINGIADNVSFIGVLGVVLSVGAGLLFPPLLPVTQVLHAVSLSAWLGGGLVRNATREPATETRVLDRMIAGDALLERLSAALAPSNENSAAGIASAPAPAADFGRAANGNKPAVADDTPRKTPPALKM